MLKRVYSINDTQLTFLKKNHHLLPITNFLDALVVLDVEARNEFGEHIAYVLTSDARVQSLSHFINNIWEVEYQLPNLFTENNND